MRALIAGILLVGGFGLALDRGRGVPTSAGPGAVRADQTADQAVEVMSTVDALFEAMAAKDTAALAAVFHPDARLASTAIQDGRPVVHGSSIEEFVRGVGSATVDLDERLGPADVKVDGPLATAWTPYAFFADGEFSHCGVNAFQLVRTDQGWKILQITDSRRRDGCPPGAPR
ncbi:MAG: DUF4440 domain-containing protein [Gemmatimonadota bacterium]|jgi:hypothetical protein